MKSVFPIPALVLLALTGLPLAAHAACPTDLEAAAVAAAIVARQPVPVPAGEMSVADGLCGRDKVVRYLAQISGPVVGYKAGLTNLAVQQRFKHDAPLRGTLFQGMLLRDGAELAVDYGIRPVFEADLVVEVADPAALAKADTPLAALKALKSYAPFIELPDLMVQTPSTISGASLSALNVGARLGVRGAPLAVPADAAGQARLSEQLRDMNVRLVDAADAPLGGGKGSDVLGHPLNAVVWLAQALKAEGLSLRPGQVVSLGSFSALLPPKAGQKVTAHYDGVTGLQPVTVSFR